MLVHNPEKILSILIRLSSALFQTYKTYSGAVVFAVAKAASKRSERSSETKYQSTPQLTLTGSFVSDFDLRKRLPLHPTDNTYKAIFPYIVYPSKFTY